ncbi:MAG: cryptochrome/photolyase family protein [Acidobacteria bacterium]|nr:MAG: cryptochrome/photolyase family protein [Acidobacteriota bacterium]REJ98109.1 MAG: cryptochrome/photolyase family protein [Acidobacteriota bacterium]REK16852.1 MAG: cryptochrome/photolyase family protein [Acidobacteriota bacterium]REK42763.1 MAG: cryptochrome/photolyase family protein [Acidobacteriota bacterium]
MCKAAIIYPHQLFRSNPALEVVELVFLVEDSLFFKQFKFHKKKLILHRAAMKAYESTINDQVSKIRYVEAEEIEETGDLGGILKGEGVSNVRYVDPVDDWLETRLLEGLNEEDIEYEKLDSPMFFNSSERIEAYFEGRDSYFLTSFYKQERERLDILMDNSGEPIGGKLTFDTDNRKKLPKNIDLPPIKPAPENEWVDEAVSYVKEKFGDNYGSAEDFFYPVTFEDAENWLDQFIDERLERFGPYQDAIAKEERFLFHSVLTPMLNCGLLTPVQVVDRVLDHAESEDLPLNSLEGFVRQVIGWREFMRGVYVEAGRKQRTSNFFGHGHDLPESLWSGNTGIDPVDDSIRSLLETGYSHHIERLMILGNFMVLTEINPDEVYRWFMTMYIDAYDWVMVPNVYGMSQYADGGMITTKPYISGSNYIRKMSDYGEGDWSKIWDGLYWRFIDKHKEFFKSNPRLQMMPRMLEKMDESRRNDLFNSAEDFLESFHGLPD